METSLFEKVLTTVDNWVWGVPLIVLIMATGILLTLRMRGLNVRNLGLALKYMVKNEEGGSGEVRYVRSFRQQSVRETL